MAHGGLVDAETQKRRTEERRLFRTLVRYPGLTPGKAIDGLDDNKLPIYRPDPPVIEKSPAFTYQDLVTLHRRRRH